MFALIFVMEIFSRAVGLFAKSLDRRHVFIWEDDFLGANSLFEKTVLFNRFLATLNSQYSVLDK